MHKDLEDTAHSPFQIKNDLENFFMDGGRAKVLAQLQESLVVGVPLLILMGEEGSGKTMLCKMLAQRAAEECVVVYFQHTVESFEDVVRIIAAKLGVVVEVNGKGVRDTIEKIMETLLEKRLHLLIVFDDAEIIYLATLERIRKMLGQMTEAGVYLHVLFSGRPSFLGNYEQLIICDFKQVEEVHLLLDPLTEKETKDYLESCIDRLPDGVEKDLFTEEIIGKICANAKGNFGTVNILMGESIEAPGDDSSFMVLLDSVADAKEDEYGGLKWYQTILSAERFLPLLPWAGGAVVIVVVLFFVFGSGDEEKRETIVPLKKVDGQEIVVKEIVSRSEPVVKNSVVVVEKDVDRGVAISDVKVDVEEKSPVKPGLQQEAIQQEIVQQEIVQSEKIQSEVEAVTGEEAGNKKFEEVLLPQENDIVELRQYPSLKKKIGAMELTRKRKKGVQPVAKIQKTGPVNRHLTVDQLYARRIAAGKEWESGAKDSMYTIQLMALTAKNAEENLKQMLAQENYRQQVENFFIFKKNGSHAVLLVYYGEYPTIAEARMMKKSIPVFLQKHKPYAMSIKGAVAKVKR